MKSSVSSETGDSELSENKFIEPKHKSSKKHINSDTEELQSVISNLTCDKKHSVFLSNSNFNLIKGDKVLLVRKLFALNNSYYSYYSYNLYYSYYS